MSEKDIYYIKEMENGFAVLVSGPDVEKYGVLKGVHNCYEYALEQVNAYIEWTGGALHD